MAAAIPFPAIQTNLFSLPQDDRPNALNRSARHNFLKPISQNDSHNKPITQDDSYNPTHLYDLDLGGDCSRPDRRFESSNTHPVKTKRADESQEFKEALEITGVFRGRELTRKERRLTCGITPIDSLIGGGIVRGRISEIVGNSGTGKTSLAAAFAASITGRGEVAAWIDAGGGFDPASIEEAGVDLARILWVATPANRTQSNYRTSYEDTRDRPGPTHRPDEMLDDPAIYYQKIRAEFEPGEGHCPHPQRPPRMTEVLERDEPGLARPEYRSNYAAKRSASAVVLKAAEWILTAGGFGLVVIDCGGMSDGRFGAFTQSAALRLARGAERSGAAVLVLAPYRMCGTFAALSLRLSRSRACFSRANRGAPGLFDGLTIEARVMRNKLGGSGGAATWSALADPSCAPMFEAKSNSALPASASTLAGAPIPRISVTTSAWAAMQSPGSFDSLDSSEHAPTAARVAAQH
jgi:recombination protein RecA